MKLLGAPSHVRGVDVVRSSAICRAYADLRYPRRRCRLTNSCDWGGSRVPKSWGIPRKIRPEAGQSACFDIPHLAGFALCQILGISPTLFFQLRG